MPATNTPSTARVLIAAENPLEAQAIEKFLRDTGYRDVRTTTDGRDIAPLYGKWPFTVLVLDMALSTLNSYAVLEHFFPRTREHRLSVVALTDRADTATQRRALAGGAFDVITRPLERVDTLLRTRWALTNVREETMAEARTALT